MFILYFNSKLCVLLDTLYKLVMPFKAKSPLILKDAENTVRH